MLKPEYGVPKAVYELASFWKPIPSTFVVIAPMKSSRGFITLSRPALHDDGPAIL